MPPVSLLHLALLPVTYFVRLIESCLFTLVQWYDDYMYSPLQSALWPAVAVIPRSVVIDGKTFNIFTANIVSWSRTLLVAPIAYSLKYNMFWTGCSCVVLHDFLDHLDGIVAKVQRHKYGQLDDPIVGGFMDAFCDKIVNVLSLWSILMVTDFSAMSARQNFVFISACAIIIAYEFTLGVVRVQDFFRAYYFREFKKVDITSNKTSTAAIMEGKLKEKLESMGIAALCVAQSNRVPLEGVSGILGVTCLLLSVRLAHSSLTSKLRARAPHIRSQAHASDDEDEMKARNDGKTEEHFEKNCVSEQTQTISVQDDSLSERSSTESRQNSRDETEKGDLDAWSIDEGDVSDVKSQADLEHEQGLPGLSRSISMPGTRLLQDISMDARAERVYTVGCFDLFHHGHVTLLQKMRTYGKKVIVGVHDSRSIYCLKKRVPIDSTHTRMKNVKEYADEVFCVAGTDPTPYIDCIFDKQNARESALYIRGDDMPQFPARHLCETLMTVKLLPYTQGVSSTKLRKELFNSSSYDIPDSNDGVMLY